MSEGTLAACVASIAGAAAADVPLDAEERRAWLAQRGLGLVPIAAPEEFSWAGPWIAIRGGEAVVMFGVPSGPILDPAGVGDAAIEAGFVVAPLDVALWRFEAGGGPGVGVVEAIVVAAAAEGEVVEVREARLVPGKGIEGDRYWAGGGTFASGRPGSALTLIDAAVVDELGLGGGRHRRNVVVRGVDVNALVGRRFAVGDAECLGRRLCEPCAHLDRLVGPGILRPLVHRGGLRADILTEGVIRVGDEVRCPGFAPV